MVQPNSPFLLSAVVTATLAAGAVVAAPGEAATTPVAVPPPSATPTAGPAPATSSTPATSPVVVEQPLQAVGGTGPADVPFFVASSGDGLTAWTTQADRGGAAPQVALWTLRDGMPKQVASLAGVAPSRVDGLDVGTAGDGKPVVVVATTTPAGTPTLRLVRLDSGAVRTISSTRDGATIGGAAIDHGRLYYALKANTRSERSRSSLWRATLSGTSIGRATLLRRSAVGARWGRILADGGRIAVEETRPGGPGSAVDAHVLWRFGTPQGAWRRTVTTARSDAGYRRIDAAGFTADHRALITTQEDDQGVPLVSRLPLAGGPARTTMLGTGGSEPLRVPALDPATGRILIRGVDATGAQAIGTTRVLFP